MGKPIDFVITWVDGNDPAWLAQKEAWTGRSDRSNMSLSDNPDDSMARYRDWDLLRYWFRGVDVYAPWVRKIHFVTWGHLPAWLDVSNPRIHIVRHQDFIPEKYLPTFNSHTIELNLHRIPDLADQFVYFNDDMYLTRPVRPTDFFKSGKPCDLFSLDALYFKKGSAGSFNAADMELINAHFDKKKQFKKYWRLWLRGRYGIRKLYRTLALLPYRWFPGFYVQHIPESYLKSTFETVWKEEEETLDQTCSCRIRTRYNVNQWLMKYWQLASGSFVPRELRAGLVYHLCDANFEDAVRDLRMQRYKMLCLNDTPATAHMEIKQKELAEAFTQILPDPCSFEIRSC